MFIMRLGFYMANQTCSQQLRAPISEPLNIILIRFDLVSRPGGGGGGLPFLLNWNSFFYGMAAAQYDNAVKNIRAETIVMSGFLQQKKTTSDKSKRNVYTVGWDCLVSRTSLSCCCFFVYMMNSHPFHADLDGYLYHAHTE